MPKHILESDVSKDETIGVEATQSVNQSVHRDTAVEEAEAPASDSDASSDGSDAPLPPKLSRSFGRTPSPEQLNIPPSPLTETIKQQSLRASFQLLRPLRSSPEVKTEQPSEQTSEDFLSDFLHTHGVCPSSGFNRGFFVPLTDLNLHLVPRTPPDQELDPLPSNPGFLLEQNSPQKSTLLRKVFSLFNVRTENSSRVNSPEQSKAIKQVKSLFG